MRTSWAVLDAKFKRILSLLELMEPSAVPGTLQPWVDVAPGTTITPTTTQTLTPAAVDANGSVQKPRSGSRIFVV